MAVETRCRSRAGSREARSPEDLIRALCHEVGNLLAAVRLTAHLDSTEIAGRDRVSASREIEDLAAQAGTLLAHVRPLLAGAGIVRVPVSPAEVLMAVSRALKESEERGAALSIARGRNLPDVRVDPDALYHLLLTLIRGAQEGAAPDGQVRVSAKHQGRRVILSVSDSGRPLEFDEIQSGAMPRGRELTVRVADAVLRLMGGRATVEPQRRGNRIELSLPALTVRKG